MAALPLARSRIPPATQANITEEDVPVIPPLMPGI